MGSREPFEFWWAATISQERLIVWGAVNLGGVDGQCDKLVMVVSHQFITPNVDICIRWAWGTASRGSDSGSGDLYNRATLCYCAYMLWLCVSPSVHKSNYWTHRSKKRWQNTCFCPLLRNYLYGKHV